MGVNHLRVIIVFIWQIYERFNEASSLSNYLSSDANASFKVADGLFNLIGGDVSVVDQMDHLLVRKSCGSLLKYIFRVENC